jgi:hypothetical protein
MSPGAIYAYAFEGKRKVGDSNFQSAAPIPARKGNLAPSGEESDSNQHSAQIDRGHREC